ncbi:DUF6582 domain-containing protein [Dactylosporangium sp. NPDC000555]|uniref:DUF6582 domain-containing protein n=1 Tax=Dactylosporangium sp. NPDC000555 TaxID=3154260 RepID=UPI0033280E94
MAARRQSTHELDAADRNAMPDRAFAFPRLRKEPLNDATHVRNAIARFDQVRDATDAEREEAFRRIKRAAKRYGVDVTERRWQELGKPTATMKSSDKPRTPAMARRNQPRDEWSRDELYAEAKRRNIRGRSTMTKAELVNVLGGR